MHKLRILKLEGLYDTSVQNILSVYDDCLEKKRMKSFNTFKRMESNQFHNTRSFNIHTN